MQDPTLIGIPFTQYLYPDGRKRPDIIDRPEPIGKAAHRLIELGYRFEIEVLQMTGEVSMEVVSAEPGDDGEPVSIAMEVVSNGPEVPIAVDRMVLNALKVVEAF